MSGRINLCPTLQKYGEGCDPDKGLVLENAAGKAVWQVARELSRPIEPMTCSSIIKNYPSGDDRVIQEGDFSGVSLCVGGGPVMASLWTREI